MKVPMHLLLIVLIFGSGVLFAQEQEMGFGPIIGYQKASGADEGNLMLGGALRMKLSPAFGIEGSINYHRERHRGGSLIVKSWPVMASALLYPVPNVYGVLGGGWYNSRFEFLDNGQVVRTRTRQEFGWHFGGGFETPFSETASLIADIRYAFIDYDFEEIIGLDNRVRSNFYVITIGLLLGL